MNYWYIKRGIKSKVSRVPWEYEQVFDSVCTWILYSPTFPQKELLGNK